MYERIVVGTDGSKTAKAAVDHAAHIAYLSSATLHLVCAVRLPSRSALMAPEFATVAHTADVDAERAGKEMLDALASKLRADGLAVRTHVSVEPPSAAICKVAEAERADVIVVGNKGMKGARRVLGSVPNAVAHKASCAVLIVPTC